MHFGTSQDLVNISVDILCFSLLAFFLAALTKHSTNNSFSAPDSLTGCTAEGSPQVFRHSLLLILYAGAFVSNIGLSGYRLSPTRDNHLPGFYQVLVYIDVL